MTGWCSTLAFGDRSPGSAEKPTRPATTHTPGELPAMGSNTVAEVVGLIGRVSGRSCCKSAADNWKRIALCKLTTLLCNAAAAAGSYSTKMAVN